MCVYRKTYNEYRRSNPIVFFHTPPPPLLPFAMFMEFHQSHLIRSNSSSILLLKKSIKRRQRMQKVIALKNVMS